MSDEPKLLCCPFCGWEKPKLRDRGSPEYPAWQINCPWCDCDLNLSSNADRDVAVAKWNQRAFGSAGWSLPVAIAPETFKTFVLGATEEQKAAKEAKPAILDLSGCPRCKTNASVEITRNRDGWTTIRCEPCGGLAGVTGVVERPRAEAIAAWEKLPRA